MGQALGNTWYCHLPTGKLYIAGQARVLTGVPQTAEFLLVQIIGALCTYLPVLRVILLE